MGAFSDLEKKADEVADAAFQRYGDEPAGPDFDGDMSVFAERAEQKGQAFYETMYPLRQAALNLFTAGLFHLLEQQLASLCHDAAFDVPPPGDTKLAVVVKWYRDHFCLDLETLPEWAPIQELNYIANTVKHAEGPSAEKLRNVRPELFHHLPDSFLLAELPVRLPLAGDDLYVTDDLFREYSHAATQFFTTIAAYFETHRDDYFPR